jgi:PAP2 superfamily
MEYRSIVEIVRPTEVIFRKQLDYLDQYADLRADRASEILTQLGVPAPFFSSIAFLHPLRTPWTLELLFVALRLAYFVVMWAKHGLACRRPHEYSPQVQPIIEVPLHGTLPSGHATEGFMFALVFWKVLQAGGRPPYDHVSLVKQLMSQAARIAINRTVAGVHFPVDSCCGSCTRTDARKLFRQPLRRARRCRLPVLEVRWQCVPSGPGFLLGRLFRCEHRPSGGWSGRDVRGFTGSWFLRNPELAVAEGGQGVDAARRGNQSGSVAS